MIRQKRPEWAQTAYNCVVNRNLTVMQLQVLKEYIEPDDVQLLEAAGVPERK